MRGADASAAREFYARVGGLRGVAAGASGLRDEAAGAIVQMRLGVRLGTSCDWVFRQ